MKVLINISIFLFLLFSSHAQQYYSPVVPVKKVLLNEKNKTLQYEFLVKNKTRKLTYFFGDKNHLKITYGSSTNRQELTIISKSKIKFFKDGRELIGNAKSLTSLMRDADPVFKKLIKNNLALSSLGYQYLYEDDIINSSQVSYIKIYTDVLGIRIGFETGRCEETSSCDCGDGRSKTAICPCGVIPVCNITTVLRCRTDTNGDTVCADEEQCIAVCN